MMSTTNLTKKVKIAKIFTHNKKPAVKAGFVAYIKLFFFSCFSSRNF